MALTDEIYPLKNIVDKLKASCKIKELCKAKGASFPEVGNVAKCASSKPACSQGQHVAITMVRRSRSNHDFLEMILVYKCLGDYFLSLMTLSDEQVYSQRWRFEYPDQVEHLISGEVSDPFDSAEIMVRGSLVQGYISAKLLAFADYSSFNPTEDNFAEFIMPFIKR